MGSEAEHHGYVSRRESQRLRARRAGLASGRRRRDLARGRRVAHARDRQEGLALAYRIPQVSRDEFEARYGRVRAAEGRSYNERGLETHWQRYMALCRCYRVKGQDFRTTNRRGARALELRGRPRCPRTVRRVDATLRAMGLARRAHVRRSGARKGQRDCLRVLLLPPFVHLASPAGATGASRPSAPAPTTRDCAGSAGRDHGPAPPGSSAPPDGGRDHRPALRPANCSDESGGARSSAELRTPAEVALIARLRRERCIE